METELPALTITRARFDNVTSQLNLSTPEFGLTSVTIHGLASPFSTPLIDRNQEQDSASITLFQKKGNLKEFTIFADGKILFRGLKNGKAVEQPNIKNPLEIAQRILEAIERLDARQLISFEIDPDDPEILRKTKDLLSSYMISLRRIVSVAKAK